MATLIRKSLALFQKLVPRTLRLTAVATVGLLTVLAVPGVVQAAPGSSSTARVLLEFRPGVPASQQASIEGSAHATRLGSIADLGVTVLAVPANQAASDMQRLSQNPAVVYAEPDGTGEVTLTPDDTYWSQQWGLQKINSPTAWDTTTGSSSVVVGVLDTGIDYSQPDLQGKTVAGYNFVAGNTNPADDNGHGTEISGILAADSNNSTGVAGVCWGCMVMPIKVCNANGSCYWSNVASGITWATDHGAKVINISIAGSGGSTTLQSAVQYAEDHGVVVVAGAGNNGSAALMYPAAYSGVISVAGSTSNDTLYSWSEYGSWVSVAAPGCDYTTLLGGSYGSVCGTSAATPVVSGLAGLAFSAAPSATASQVGQAIETSAVNIGSVVEYGRVDAAATLSALGATSSTSSSSTSTSGSGSGSSGSSATTTTTSTFSGTLTGKFPSRSYSVTVATGPLSASLPFTKAGSMSLALADSTGSVVAQSSGPSPVTVSYSASAGTYTLMVSGPQHASFTLAVTYQQ